MANLANAALLLLRITLSLVVLGHGIQKVSFRLGGGGLAKEAAILTHDGVRGGRISAAASGVTQIGAGLICGLGILTPLAAAGIIGVMVVASSTKFKNGFWVQNDGIEFPLFLVFAATILALAGPGAWSLDHLASIHRTIATSVGAIGLGVVSGSASVPLLKQRPSRSKSDSSNGRRALEMAAQRRRGDAALRYRTQVADEMEETMTVPADFEQFMGECHAALTQQTKGHSESLLALWSQTPEDTVFAAVGGYQIGFDDVSALLSHVSKSLNWDTWEAETLALHVEGDVAYTVELETMTRAVEGETEQMVLRASQFYRRVDGS